MFSLTSKVTASLIQELIDALNLGIDGTGANALNEAQKELLESIQSSIKVVGIGGPSEANSALISSGDLSQYFAVDAPLTSMVPISYELRTVKGDNPAVISRTTNYEQKECTPNTNILPVISSMNAIENNLEVTVNATVNDIDGQITDVEINWGDGTIESITSNSIITEKHSYADDKTYDITLTITDNQNGKAQKSVTAQPSFNLREGLIAEFTSFEAWANRILPDTSGQGHNGFTNKSGSSGIITSTDRFGFADKAFSFFGSGSVQTSVIEVRSSIEDANVAYGPNYSMALWIEGNRFGYMIGTPEDPIFDSPGLMKQQSADSLAFEVPKANFKLVDPQPKGDGWAFYVVTISRNGSSSDIKLYRDGVLANEGTLENATDLRTASPIMIGAKANYEGTNGGLDFKGLLDDIRVYNRVLSAGEINALYKDGGWTGNP